MGALNFGNLAAGAYGATRGMQDEEARQQQRQAFGLDLETRREALDQSKAQAPVRQKALELGVEHAQQQINQDTELQPMRRSLLQSQINISDLNETELRDLTKERREARARLDGINAAIGTRDPQALAEAWAKAYPGKEIENPVGKIDEQGRLVLTGDGQKEPLIIAPGKDKNTGEPIDIWQGAAHTANFLANPVAYAEKKWDSDRKIDQQAAAARATGAQRLAVANVNAAARKSGTEDKAETQRVKTETGRLTPIIREQLGSKTSFSGIVGEKSDEELRTTILARADAKVREKKMSAPAAAAEALDEVSEDYDTVVGAAKKYSDALVKAGVDPRDENALSASDDPNAQKLQKLMTGAEGILGRRTVKYIRSTLPTTGKKKK